MKQRTILLIFLISTLMAVSQTPDTSIIRQPHTDSQMAADTVLPSDTALKALPISDAFYKTDSLKKNNLFRYPTPFTSTYAEDTSLVTSYDLENEWLFPTSIQPIDTTQRYFHYVNPLYEKERYYISLGNTGLAAKNLFFKPGNQTGFNYGEQVFDIYNLDENTLRFYRSQTPYTKLFHLIGPDKEQILNVHHSQRIYKTLTLGTDIHIINSVGSYLYQKAEDRRVAVTLHYVSENDRYNFQAFYAHNKYTNGENGGIVNDSIFENNQESDRLIFDINFEEAQNLSKNASIFFRQSFELSTSKSKADSLRKKTVKPFNFGRIQHQFKYYRKSHLFTENNYPTSYYQNIFKDSLQTRDTAYIQTIENTFSWNNSRLLRTQKSIGFDFGVTHRLIRFEDSLQNKNYNQLAFHARVSKSLIRHLKIGGELEYIQGNINQNDFRLSGIITNNIKNKIAFQAGFDQISREPDYFYQHYYSNHFRWDNDFNKENIVKIHGAIEFPFLKAGANYYLLTNYTYLDATPEPRQIERSFSVFQAWLFPSFRFWNLSWDSYLYLQKTSNDALVRIPLLAGKSSLYYNNSLFDEALLFQIGVDAKYKGSYFADNYMPALRSFYVQDDKKIGDFFYIDAYVTFTIKRTHLMLKYMNITEGLTPYNYYDSPHYPMKDRALLFAISWRFHD